MLHTSGFLLDNKSGKSSSKIEDTVKRLKEKQLENLEELSRAQDLEEKVKSVISKHTQEEKEAKEKVRRLPTRPVIGLFNHTTVVVCRHEHSE